MKTAPPQHRLSTWLASGAMHIVLVTLLAVGVASRGRTRVAFFTLDAPQPVAIPSAPAGGPSSTIGNRPLGGIGGRGRGQPRVNPAPAVPPPLHTPGAVTRIDSLRARRTPSGPIVAAPRMSDSRIWPSPRPALPAEVAQALYDHPDTVAPRDSAAVRRLKAMVDSLNQVIDMEQREHRLPAWTTDIAGKKFGMDSSGIYVAGVKIPTAVLALLGNNLPQGNFDESLRARQMEDMRQDILQAARRTQTLQDFRRYVHELRERKQAEHDADERARGVKKDTVKATP